MAKLTTEITASVTKNALVAALRELTVNAEDFDHRRWAIRDAEAFESAARMIREGYGQPGEGDDEGGRGRGEIDQLRDLIRHCWVHSGYRDCGYYEMDSGHRDLYRQVIGRSDRDQREIDETRASRG